VTRGHNRPLPARLIVTAALVASVAAACGPQAAQQVADVPNCRADNNSLILMAQAVPSASEIPCIQALPAGWTFRSLDVRSGTARFWLSSDRAGTNALEVVLTASCRRSGTPIPYDEPEVSVYQVVDTLTPRYRGDRAYVFDSGCIVYRFDFPPRNLTVFTTDAISAVGTISRERLEKYVASLGFDL
jgi:hypothetical protein